MTDPVTLGTLATLALAFAGEAVARPGIGELVKDAYKALKDRLTPVAEPDIAALEKSPTSPTRQAVIAEIIDQQSPTDQADIQRLARALNEALHTAAKSQPIGIDIGKLEAARIGLDSITVTEGTGFRAQEIKTTGDFTAGPIKVGNPNR